MEVALCRRYEAHRPTVLHALHWLPSLSDCLVSTGYPSWRVVGAGEAMVSRHHLFLHMASWFM